MSADHRCRQKITAYDTKDSQAATTRLQSFINHVVVRRHLELACLCKVGSGTLAIAEVELWEILATVFWKLDYRTYLGNPDVEQDLASVELEMKSQLFIVATAAVSITHAMIPCYSHVLIASHEEQRRLALLQARLKVSHQEQRYSGLEISNGKVLVKRDRLVEVANGIRMLAFGGKNDTDIEVNL